jgi:hypothetical protein
MIDKNSFMISHVTDNISIFTTSAIMRYINVYLYKILNKDNNKITELRTILQRESQNS